MGEINRDATKKRWMGTDDVGTEEGERGREMLSQGLDIPLDRISSILRCLCGNISYVFVFTCVLY